MKHYTTPDNLRLDSFRLGQKIIQDNFKPDYLIALWRGGATIGCYIHEILKYIYEPKGHKVDHIAIRTSRYTGIDTTLPNIEVHNLGYLVERLTSESKVLIVDDVYDSGLSMAAVLTKLELGTQMSNNIKIATIDYKPARNKTDRVPDYYVNISDKWEIYPHELEGLNIDEISNYFGTEIADIISSCVNTH